VLCRLGFIEIDRSRGAAINVSLALAIGHADTTTKWCAR
jgi:hypothetical protein